LTWLPDQQQERHLSWQSPLLEDLLADIQDCESELGTYGPLET
jgi:hypothetical protein